MGLDLILMPVTTCTFDEEKIQQERELVQDVDYDRLNLIRDYAIFAQISYPDGKPFETFEGVRPKISTFNLPEGYTVRRFFYEGENNSREASSGRDLVYTTVKELKRLKIPQETDVKNKAIMAYIGKLDPETPVIIEID